MNLGASRDINDLLKLWGEAFQSNERRLPRLVRLPDDRSIVFAGDIHGDRDAVETVFSRFPTSDHMIVFLGDIVDRGADSLGAMALIAQEKLKAPSCVHLLMGNHEARSISYFRPADFWDSLPEDQSERLAHHLMKLPLAAWHPLGILTTHGGLPDLPSLEAIDNIELGSAQWRALTWGDWVDEDRKSIALGNRPAFGPTAFEKRSSQLGIKIHIRSHQPTAPLYLFNDRCLTLFTTVAYGGGKRQVARLMPGRQIDTARDLELIEI
ncbi:serine/threonine protein phosphatase [Candidatus Bipolaricaulota bacterium]|nr:serine/threonine protein phosphatase [Candidatus Bipolaricaulota bacterium]